jgi:hypothetical protein
MGNGLKLKKKSLAKIDAAIGARSRFDRIRCSRMPL